MQDRHSSALRAAPVPLSSRSKPDEGYGPANAAVNTSKLTHGRLHQKTYNTVSGQRHRQAPWRSRFSYRHRCPPCCIWPDPVGSQSWLAKVTPAPQSSGWGSALGDDDDPGDCGLNLGAQLWPSTMIRELTAPESVISAPRRSRWRVAAGGIGMAPGFPHRFKRATRWRGSRACEKGKAPRPGPCLALFA